MGFTVGAVGRRRGGGEQERYFLDFFSFLSFLSFLAFFADFSPSASRSFRFFFPLLVASPGVSVSLGGRPTGVRGAISFPSICRSLASTLALFSSPIVASVVSPSASTRVARAHLAASTRDIFPLFFIDA